MPGFATSRLGLVLGLEAIRMMADGVASGADIDKAMMAVDAPGGAHPQLDLASQAVLFEDAEKRLRMTAFLERS
jgi:enoyl-CoA hydratase